MWSIESGTPFRFITRCLVEFQMESLKRALLVFPGDINRALIFALIARVACRDWIVDRCIAAPELHTPITISSVAGSLARPFETVRRHIIGMIDDGICSKSEDGVFLAPRPDREADVIDHFIAQAALLNHLVSKLVQADVPIPTVGKPDDANLYMLPIAALDIALIPLEKNRYDYRNWHELTIHGALIHENAADVMRSPELTAEYGNKVIPDDLRKPVGIGAIADLYGIPYPTVRRHFLAMEEAGQLYRKGRGYILNTEWTGDPAMIEISNRNVQYLLRHLRTLASAGVDLRATFIPDRALRT
jgi:DNA-binding transcriptional ArsR family regulator